jgi:hypothetical protein
VEAVTFPSADSDLISSWHLREILDWFDQRGIEFFEGLEIWQIRVLDDEFRKRVGRAPRPDLSYRPTWPARAQRFGRRLVNAARRRLPV